MKNIPKLKVSIGWLIVVSLLLFYISVRMIGLLTPSESDHSWVNRIFVPTISSIFDNLFAALVFAALAYWLRDSIIDAITGSFRVKSFNGYEGFSKELANATELTQGKNVCILMATPILFSEGMAKAVKDNPETEFVTNFSKVGNEIRNLVNAGKESYEFVLLGKTSSTKLNLVIHRIFCDIYSSSSADAIGSPGVVGGIPATTEVGYHNNLNEGFALIVCEQDKSNPAMPSEGIFMIQATFSDEFTKIIGFTTNQKTIIREYWNFYLFRIAESKASGQYFVNNSTKIALPTKVMRSDAGEINEIKVTMSDFEKAFSEFFSRPGEGYQYTRGGSNGDSF